MKEKNQRERLLEHIRERYAVEPEYLWAKTPDAAVCRRAGSGKWFAAFLNVRRDRLGLAGEEIVEILDIKCSPLLLGSLLESPGFRPAYHMNESAWITVLLDGTVKDSEIFPLLEWSYDSVAPRGRRSASAPSS